MTRSDFIKSITDVELTNLMMSYFSQTMALYNLIGENNFNISVKGDKDKEDISFLVIFENKNNMNEILSSINGSKFTLHDNNFTVDAELYKDNIISIRLL